MNLQSFSGQTGGENISALLNKPDPACFHPKIRKPLSCFNSNPIKNALQSISDCLLETQPCFIKFSDVFQQRSAEPCCRQLHDVLRCQCLIPLNILCCCFINEFYSCFASSLTILQCFLQVPLKNLRPTLEYPAVGFSLLMYPAVRSISPTMCSAVGSLLYQYADVDVVAVGSSLHRCTDLISLSRSSLHRCTQLLVLLSPDVPHRRFFSPPMCPTVGSSHPRCTPLSVYTTGHYELFHKARGECQQRGYSLFKNRFVLFVFLFEQILLL